MSYDKNRWKPDETRPKVLVSQGIEKLLKASERNPKFINLTQEKNIQLTQQRGLVR